MTTTVDGLYDQMISFDEDHHSGKQDTLIIKREQEIPDDYIAQLKRDKIDTTHDRMGDFVRLCTVPMFLVEKWQREGFDVYQEGARAIMARLRKEQADALITTNMRY